MSKMLNLILIASACQTLWAEDIRIKFEDLKQLVETRNDRIQAAHKDAEASKIRKGHLLRSFLPRIDAHASSESFQSGTQKLKSQPDYGAEASINLYNGGKDSLKEEAQTFRSQRKDIEIKTYVSEELSKARVHYWNIVFGKSTIPIFREAIDTNSKNLQSALRRIRSGIATDTDRLEFEMKAIELKQELIRTELEVRATSRELLILLGYDPDDELISDTEISHKNEWESEIKHSHHDHDFLIKPAELYSNEIEATAKEASRNWLPKIEAFAGWNQYNQREREPADQKERQESVFGIRLKLNILDGWNSQREAQALRNEVASAKLLANYQRKEIEAHVENEFAELKFLHDQVHVAEENIKSAQIYYKLTQSEYGRGVKNSPDVLGASEKLYSMKIKRLEMIKDFQIARSHVLSKSGK